LSYILIIYMAHQDPKMRTAKLFRNGDSQAVRLPKEFRFEGRQVLIKRVGTAVVLLPEGRAWDVLTESLRQFSADFMARRDQPVMQEREPVE